MAVKLVLAAALAPRDSLVLWHLLSRLGPPRKNTKEASFDPEVWLPFLRLAAWQ